MSLRWIRVAGTAVAGLAVLLLQTACDPCFGVFPECTGAPSLTVQGRLVVTNTGESVEGAEITVARSGQTTESEAATTRTDGTGFFQVTLPSDEGEVTFDVVVGPPNLPPYTVRGLKAPASKVRGEAHDLGVWVSQPYFKVIGELIFRCTAGEIVPPVPITFTRISGPILSGVLGPNGVFETKSDEGGHFLMFGPSVLADAVLPLRGVISVPLPHGRFVSGVTIHPAHLFRDPGTLIQVPLAPEASHSVCLYDRALVKPALNIRIEFVRKGGVETGVQYYTTVSDGRGLVSLKLDPQGPGPVFGTLTIHSPPPSRNYSIDTTLYNVADPLDPGTPLLGVGLHLPYVGRINLPKVRVVAKRVGGIPALPDSVMVESDAAGQFILYGLKPGAAGDLIVDLMFYPPAPHRNFVLRGVRLPTIDRDSHAILLLDLDINKQNGEPLTALPGSAPPHP